MARCSSQRTRASAASPPAPGVPAGAATSASLTNAVASGRRALLPTAVSSACISISRASSARGDAEERGERERHLQRSARWQEMIVAAAQTRTLIRQDRISLTHIEGCQRGTNEGDLTATTGHAVHRGYERTSQS